MTTTNNGKTERQPVTACKQYYLAAGATQGYDRLHAKRYRSV